MARIEDAMKILSWIEHSNDNERVLHKNRGELGLTFFGIYQSAHPTLSIWNTINKALKIEPNIKKAGAILMKDNELLNQVNIFYKREFWDKMRLDEVDSQHIANEIFVFGVNVFYKTAIRVSQKLIGVESDGVIGPKTLTALNSFNENTFDREFDQYEIEYYKQVAINKPHIAHNLNGWIYRARYVTNELYQNSNFMIA